MENASSKRLSWIAAIVVSVCLCLAAWLLSGLLNRSGGDAMLTDVVLLPCSASQPVEIWDEGVIYSDGSSLHALNDAGRQEWTYPVGSGLDFDVGESAIAAWSGTTLTLLESKSGASILTTTMSDDIFAARVGPTYAAVLIGEEQSATMVVLDLNGRQIDSIDLSSLTVLDFDFFSNGSMLWVMSLNTEGSQPMSQVTTYRPGRVQSGSIVDTEQVVYRVLFTDSDVQTVGTTHLKHYDYTAGLEKEDQRTLLYGWTLVDCQEGNSPLMIFAPESQVDTTSSISDLRLIQGSTERIVRLPFPCYMVYAGGNSTLYGFSERYVILHSTSASRAVAYSLPFETTSCLGITSKNAAVLVSGDSLYLVSLP